MGGVSSSRLRIADGVLTFTGRVRLENGGGFAGIPLASQAHRLVQRLEPRLARAR